jgi:glycosyltransferase involved in cell wall biosynthesis
MSKISACLIVKNEESILERALRSIAPVCDEIIITDTGSTDKTLEIAKKFTDKIYHFTWVYDSSAARNFCEKYAQFDFVLRWDADWILQPGGLATIEKLKKVSFDGTDVVYFTWNSELSKDGKPLTSQPNYFLFRNGMFTWQSPIHNRLITKIPNQKFITHEYLKVQVDHYKDPLVKKHRYIQTLKILEKELANPQSQLHVYLRPFYVDALMHEGRFEEAIIQLNLQKNEIMDYEIGWQHLEKTIRCLLSLNQISEAQNFLKSGQNKYSADCRYQLLSADLESLFNPITAADMYEAYLAQIDKIKSGKMLNFERQIVHPYVVLGKLYRLLGDPRKSRENLTTAISLTRNLELKKELNSLLTNIN